MTSPKPVSPTEFKIADAIKVLKVFVGDTGTNSPDANGDGRIGIDDAILILRTLAGLG